MDIFMVPLVLPNQGSSMHTAIVWIELEGVGLTAVDAGFYSPQKPLQKSSDEVAVLTIW